MPTAPNSATFPVSLSARASIREVMHVQDSAILNADMSALRRTIAPDAPRLPWVLSAWLPYVADIRVSHVSTRILRWNSPDGNSVRVLALQTLECIGYARETFVLWLTFALDANSDWKCLDAYRTKPNLQPPDESTTLGVWEAVMARKRNGPLIEVDRLRWPCQSRERADQYLQSLEQERGSLNVTPDMYTVAALANLLSPITATVASHILKHGNPHDRVREFAAFWFRSSANLWSEFGQERCVPGLEDIVERQLLTIDEQCTISRDKCTVIGHCDSLASVAISILTAGGIARCDSAWVYILAGDFAGQAVVILSIDDKAYVICNRETYESSPQPRAYSQVLRAFNCYAWLDPEDLVVGQSAALSLLHRYVANNGLSQSHPAKSKPMRKWSDADYAIREGEDINSYRRRIMSILLEIARNDPSSTEAHALYVHQTTAVSNPEVYLQCSMRSADVAQLAAITRSPDEIFGWIAANLGSTSIFTELDRVMLGPQVIRHRTAGPLDRALLAVSLLNLNRVAAHVLVTSAGTYVAHIQRGAWKTTDMDDLVSVRRPRGKELLKIGA